MKPNPFRWCNFGVPKKGNSAAEYEDASAGDAGTGRFAVADGASESSYAGEWAGCLVRGFVESPLPASEGGWVDWLPPLQQKWQGSVPAAPESISWFAEEKRYDGAFATFLGIELTATEREQTYSAVAVGDSCLFQVRDDRLLKSFPLTDAAEFGTRPALLSSKKKVAGAPGAEKRLAGNYLSGDLFFLMTDALAAWFLDRCEAAGTPWRDLNEIRSLPDAGRIFETWIQSERAAGTLKNDDVALVVVEAL